MKPGEILVCVILMLGASACSRVEFATPTPTEIPTKFARVRVLDTPVSSGLPSSPPSLPPTATSPRATPTISRNTPSFTAPPRSGTPTVSRKVSPTTTPLAVPRVSPTLTPRPVVSPTRPPATATATQATACPPLTLPAPRPSGLVKSVTLGTLNNSVLTPTTTFSPAAKIHAIVTVQHAPANTRVKAAWYANDVGRVAPCNTFIDAAELSSMEGSFTVDFSLDPTNPVGTYRVEILLNNNLEHIATFTIR